MQHRCVIIVGAGPSGLSVAACLTRRSIPFIVLERDDCFASLWFKYSYDRLHLHLRKQFCELPHMSFPPSYPQYVPKKQFLQYLNDYVSHFRISPLYGRTVERAKYDEGGQKWRVQARNGDSGEVEEYSGRFLVVATGENSEPFVPEVEGLGGFKGRVIHSTGFKSGKEFKDEHVLVVGSGNSGVEIALDLANHGAKASILIRSSIHLLSRGMTNLGLMLLKYLPLNIVDSLLVILSRMVYGDVSKFRIKRPQEGPFSMKIKYGKYPVIDVGTYEKIKSGEIQVIPEEIESVDGNDVVFKNGRSQPFDSIVFCTGFKRSTHKWLKGNDSLLNDDGIPKLNYPNHWKGKNGLYCVGLSRRGFYGASADAENILSQFSIV
ncbi:probable indole-3-pyruvate monooxygenase YUCCA10 [Prosopis cineraria]|uniref:probable indole-3-pyruvate monooxygenase YUCCA10 n=1 Tax=Prosopis cineraria TaxID=364024 RepID=UPI00240E9DC2|nr:probable indole-3-pyruvate monooxygenase YUCCA10 [Prosopis cineraria]XP_054811219.1 probable indole-3-pyruvate monooxygenase YUCCA10 [Prosopis cineraria]